MTVARTAPPFALLVALTAASPFAMNAMMPAFPAIEAYFNTSYATVLMALNLALLSFGASQLVLGPLSDRFGRRPVMIGGFSLFVIGSFVAALAPTPEVLIIGRAVQSAGGAAGLVLGRTIAHDINGREGAASAIGYMTMAMALSQLMAPFAGGMLQEHLGWQSIFWSLAVAGCVLFALTLWLLVETHAPKPHAALRRSMLADGLELMGMRSFWAFAGNMACASGMYFAFSGGAPYVVQTLMGRSPGEFGLWCMFLAGGYSIGNFATGRFSGRLGPQRLIQAGMVLLGVGVALFWLLSGWRHPLALFGPMGLVAISNGMTLPSAMACAMSLSPRLAGSASGVAGALQMLFGAALSYLVGHFLEDSDVPLLVVLTATYALSLAFLMIGGLQPDAVADPERAAPVVEAANVR